MILHNNMEWDGTSQCGLLPADKSRTKELPISTLLQIPDNVDCIADICSFIRHVVPFWRSFMSVILVKIDATTDVGNGLVPDGSKLLPSSVLERPQLPPAINIFKSYR